MLVVVVALSTILLWSSYVPVLQRVQQLLPLLLGFGAEFSRCSKPSQVTLITLLSAAVGNRRTVGKITRDSGVIMRSRYSLWQASKPPSLPGPGQYLTWLSTPAHRRHPLAPSPH